MSSFGQIANHVALYDIQLYTVLTRLCCPNQSCAALQISDPRDAVCGLTSLHSPIFQCGRDASFPPLETSWRIGSHSVF